MSSIDEQFVEYIVKSLVGNPDAVSIKRTIDEKGVLLELTVDPEDLGRVIGKRGGTAQSIRTLLRALGTKNDARYNLKIVDNGEGRPSHPLRDDSPSFKSSDDSGGAVDDSKTEGADSDEVSDSWTSKPAESEADSNKDEDHATTLSKTRKELADLDDLEV